MNDLFYRPNDDTYTFIETLKERILELNKYKVVLEIGCGNGLITKFLVNNVKSAIILSSDINQEALIETSKYNTNLVRSSLLQNIHQNFVDAVVFNPPYVETSDIEVCYDDIRASYSGGLNGRRIIDDFINEIAGIKVIFLLAIRKNKPENILERFRSKGYKADIIRVRRVMGETINIIRAEILNI